jgi:hypothetical protein
MARAFSPICETDSMSLAQGKAAHDQLMTKATGRRGSEGDVRALLGGYRARCPINRLTGRRAARRLAAATRRIDAALVRSRTGMGPAVSRAAA